MCRSLSLRGHHRPSPLHNAGVRTPLLVETLNGVANPTTSDSARQINGALHLFNIFTRIVISAHFAGGGGAGGGTHLCVAWLSHSTIDHACTPF